MSEKHVKLFEELDQEGLFDEEEQENPDDSTEITNEIDYDNLLPGQQRALDRGDDLLTPAQYAACYVRAQYAVAKSEDSRRDGDTSLTRTAMNMANDQEEDWRTAPVEKLGFYMGRKPSTVSWTVRKFKDMLNGNTEGSSSNHMYKLIQDYFYKFESMPAADVLAGAERAIMESPNDDAWEEYRAKQSASSSKSAATIKQERENIRPEIRKNLLNLKESGKSLTDAVRLTVSSLAHFTNMSKKTIAEEGMIEFKNEDFIREEFRKLLKKL